MRWEEIEKQFEIDIDPNVPVFPMNVACELLHMQYHVLHQILQQGLLERERKKMKKSRRLFSRKDICRLRYIQHLMEEEGVNIKGVKMILQMLEDW